MEHVTNEQSIRSLFASSHLCTTLMQYLRQGTSFHVVVFYILQLTQGCQIDSFVRVTSGGLGFITVSCRDACARGTCIVATHLKARSES
jgi:hypothetical protein